MRLRRSMFGGLLGLMMLAARLLAPAASLAAPAPTSAATSTACVDGHWPAAVQGVPTLFRAGAAAGDYVWHDSTGWHLRVTHHGTSRVVFTGRIVSNAPMTAGAVRLEGGDSISLSADHRTLTYRLINHGGIDGLNIRTACATRLTFSGLISGARLPTGRIWIGRVDHHPRTNPFTVARLAGAVAMS
jgi:hypothetical protein